jgi:HK97 family phage major capsid protein
MRNNDALTRNEIRAKIQQAIKDGNTDEFSVAFDEMIQNIGDDVQQRAADQVEEMKQGLDTSVLTARGVRQLTSKEKVFYQKLIGAMKEKDPRQALNNLDVVMPETVIDAVFDELQTSHPLLSHIQFTNTRGAIRMMMNTNGYQEAAWGQLCDEIVRELTSGFKEVDTGLLKLSAFMPVCKAMLDLGPEWLDSFVRQVLYEAYANGLEAGIVAGDGNEMPIGMNRQVGDNVTVTGGVYPVKAPVAVSDLSPATVGNLLSLMAVDPNGKARNVRDVILVVNPVDYFQKIMPATTMMTPNGTYANDVMPYPMTVIQSPAVEQGQAIMGLGYKYFAAIGSARDGRIEYSDHYRFLEDERVYLIKGYANGFPMDNNAFFVLDISAIQPAVWKVQQVDAPDASDVATLADLRIGGLTLSPAFAAGTTTYTASTTNATNTVMAIPADANATIEITNQGPSDDAAAPVVNGRAVTWKEGANTLIVKVTAANGTATKSYTATVTKSGG